MDDVLSVYVAPLDLEFSYFFISLGLVQIVKEATHYPSGNIIDLFLCTDIERIGSCDVLSPLPGCSHGAVKIRYLFQEFTARTDHESSMNRLWSRGKYNIIGHCLDAIDWEYELESLDVDAQYCVFVNYLFPLIRKYVPLTDTFNKGSVPWSVNSPCEILRRKNDAWSLYKSLRSVLGRVDTTTVQAWEAFRTVNSEIKYFAINSQRTYEQLLGDQLGSSPHLFHS